MIPNFNLNILTFVCRYGLVTEQKKGTYKYFIDLGDRMEVAIVKTSYVDEVRSKLPLILQHLYSCHRIDKPKWRKPRLFMGLNLERVLQEKTRRRKPQVSPRYELSSQETA